MARAIRDAEHSERINEYTTVNEKMKNNGGQLDQRSIEQKYGVFLIVVILFCKLLQVDTFIALFVLRNMTAFMINPKLMINKCSDS